MQIYNRQLTEQASDQEVLPVRRWITSSVNCGLRLFVQVRGLQPRTTGSWASSWIHPKSYLTQWCTQTSHHWSRLWLDRPLTSYK